MTQPEAYSGEITIQAPRSRVWEVLSTPAIATQWAGVFGDDAPSFSGKWEEGAEWVCMAEHVNYGIVGLFVQCQPEVMAGIKYIAEVANGVRSEVTQGEYPEGAEVHDSFSLEDGKDGTVLSVRSALTKTTGQLMMTKWPLVLQKIKELAESG